MAASTSITIKAVMIGVIVLILLVPLTMLRGLVNERAALLEQAYSRVAEGWGGGSVVGGPMLVVPTERFVLDNNVRKIVRTDVYLLPAQLDMNVDMKLEAEPRYVGIYAVPVYLSALKLTGRFDAQALDPFLNREGVTYLWNQARIRLPLSQSRSLREVSVANFGTTALKFVPAAPDNHII